MKKIFLSIETSLNRIYLVLYSKTKLFSEGKKIESSIEVEINKMLENLFLKSNLNYADLDFVAISLGPGSYTGTRVGLAAAKAVSVSFDKPLLGYSNFETLYNQGLINNYYNTNQKVGVILRASKYEFYYKCIDHRKVENTLVMKKEVLHDHNKLSNILIGNIEEKFNFNNYSFCFPKQEAVLKTIKNLYTNFNKLVDQELEPLYIKGHYAEKKK